MNELYNGNDNFTYNVLMKMQKHNSQMAIKHTLF